MTTGMLSHISPLTVAIAVMMGCAGFAFGLAYFAVSRRTVTLILEAESWAAPLALTLARIGAAAIFLGLAAKLGAAALLTAFAGFLLARKVALGAARKAG